MTSRVTPQPSASMAKPIAWLRCTGPAIPWRDRPNPKYTCNTFIRGSRAYAAEAASSS